MSKTITITSPDMAQFGAYLSKHPETFREHAQVAMKKSLLLLERDAKIFAPSNEGTLRKSIKTTLRPLEGAVLAMAKYAEFVHDGTKPHMPPTDPGGSLDRWAKKKGIPTFLVARAIARRGTKAQPFFDEAIEANEGKINSLFSEAIQATVTDIATNG